MISEIRIRKGANSKINERLKVINRSGFLNNYITYKGTGEAMGGVQRHDEANVEQFDRTDVSGH